VSLETCKTDARGHTVHEFCYSLRLAGEPEAALERTRHELSIETRRSWKEIAMEVVGERDRQRFQEVVEELGAALAALELGNKLQDHLAENNPNPGSKVRQRIACEKIVDVAVSLMRADYASLQMLFPERGRGGELQLVAFRGFNPQAAKFWEWVRADSKSTCGMALRDTARVVASDIANCDFMADSEDRQVYLQAGIRACQTTPLIARAGNLVGMISTHWRSPHQPSERAFQAFDILARQAADLIERCKRDGEL
jgi:GAF domain-containing protein